MPLASLVHDNGGYVVIPESMGTPTLEQMQGTVGEQLGELASRICYDSLGYDERGKARGRSSLKLHAHILEVINLSVYEHYNFTVRYKNIPHEHFFRAVANRKGIWIEITKSGDIEITTNLRAILEWKRWERLTNESGLSKAIQQTLIAYGHTLAPEIIRDSPDTDFHLFANSSLKQTDELTADQAWISLYLYGSRGFCYTPDTEVLTKEGWKQITDLRDDETLLTLDPVSKKGRWSKNKKLHSFDYAGKTHWIESSQWVSPSVTSEHLMWCARYEPRDRRGLSLEEIMDLFGEKIPMNRLIGKRFVVSHAIEMESTKNPETILGYSSKLLFAWLGWMATDGHLDGNRCKITQMKEWNKSIIRQLMDSLFLNRWSEHGDIFEINDSALASWALEMIGPLKESRDLRPLYQLHPSLIEAFLTSVILGDGNSNENVNGTKYHDVIYTSYYSVAQQYQTLIALTGRSSNIRFDDRVGTTRFLKTGQEIRNNLVGYVVSIHEKGASIVKKEHHRSQSYIGKVYCPETEDGVIYVRRRGMAFWCSNTHEQVRHRFAMSQRSTRYVDESKSEWIMHPLIRKYMSVSDPASASDMYGLIINAVEAGRSAYSGICSCLENYLLDQGVDKATAKKQARGSSRGYLGNALASEMIFSAPVTGWLWILNQRASRFADAEIREVYEPVLHVLKHSKYGHFFSHLETIPSPDGMGRVLS